MKRYLLLLLLLLPFYVKAVDGYKVYIEDDNIQVKLNNEIVSDYSDILEYNNRVLTVKEGAYINCIYFNDIDLTVTSNNKVAYIGDISHSNYSTDVNVHKTLTIRDYKNDENTPWSFNINARYSKIEVYNSEVYNLSSFYTENWFKNVEASFKASDCKFIGPYANIHPAGFIEIENVDFDGTYIQSENSYLLIKNCNLNMHGNLYNDGGEGYIEIYDSNIKFNGESQSINLYNGSTNPSRDYAIKISNSTVTGGRVYYSTDRNLPIYIEKSNMTTALTSVDGFLYIKDSNIKMDYTGSNSYISLRGMLIENSYLETNVNLDEYHEDNSIVNSSIKNSTIKINGILYEYNNLSIDSSYIEASVIHLHENTTVNNSYIKVVRPSGINYSIKVALLAEKRLYMNNSYLFAKVVEDDMYPLALLQNDFSYDNNLMVTDENGTPLKLIYDDDSYVYSYDTGGNSLPNTVTLRAKANVTFKIVNGTWADGSIDDIVITKDVWDTLNEDEIPSIEGLPNGHWEIVPTTSDYIKGDVTYVYVIDKQVKGVEENPKTGISNIYTIISLIVAIGLSIVYFKNMRKSYFR